MAAPRVLIAGAGPAGCALAGELARAGFRVLLCDHSSRRPGGVGECVPPSARANLHRLGLSDALNQPRFARCTPGIRQWWGSAVPHDRDFLNHAGGEGWHLDRALFDAELLKLAQAAGAEFRTGTTVTRAARDAGGVWTTLVCNGERIAVERTEYLVDATGRAARLARMLGATIQRHEQFIALHALLAPAEGAECDDRLWLEAARDGWAYSAPLPEGKLSVGFVTTTTHRAGPQTLRAAALFSQTTETLSRLAPDWTKVSWRARLAGNTQLSLACDEGWFAVGDAVAAFDPLTSYGLTFALGSAILAGEAIVECVQGRTDVALIGYRSAIQHTSELTRVGLSQLYATETRWREAPFWRAARARSYDKCAKEVAVIHQLN